MKWLLKRPNAFTVAGFILFVSAWLITVIQAFSSFEFKVASLVDKVVGGFAILFLALGFAAHLARIYITLHKLEIGGKLRKKFLSGLNTNQRKIEFVFRVLLIIVLSTKITPLIPIVDTQKFGLFFGVVYTVLFTWDVLLWKFRGIAEWKFLVTSVIGFLTGWILFGFGFIPSFEEKCFSIQVYILGLSGAFIAASVIIPWIWERNSAKLVGE